MNGGVCQRQVGSRLRVRNGNLGVWVDRVRERYHDRVGPTNRNGLDDRVVHPGINRESVDRGDGGGDRLVECDGHGVARVSHLGWARSKGVGKLCRIVRDGLGGDGSRVVSSAVLDCKVEAE